MTRSESDTPRRDDDRGEAAVDAPSATAAGVNTGYVLGQLARALAGSREHADGATRTRAARRVQQWVQVLSGMARGVLDVGSRTPVAGTPAWATLQVVTGGIATGELLAGGPLVDEERDLLAHIEWPGDARDAGAARAALNAYYLSEAGMRELLAVLERGAYSVVLPEEGALLAVAWLLAHGADEGVEQARAVLEEIGPHFPRVRFYPLPAPVSWATSIDDSALVRLQDVGMTLAALQGIEGRPVVARQREAAGVWAPLYDRMVELFLETVESALPQVCLGVDGQAARRADGSYEVQGGWPCQRYPDGWSLRARALLSEYERLRAAHPLCRSPERRNRSFGQLRAHLATCSDDPRRLTGRDVTHIRAILAGFIHKRGLPASESLRRARAAQQRQATRPTTAELAAVLVQRLRSYPQGGGLASVERVLAPIGDEESGYGVPAGHVIPATLAAKVLRSWEAPIQALVERGVITSGEVLARAITQLTGPVRAAGIAEPALRHLYSAIYSAFRRRRSLLLLNLRSQVKLEELPWVQPLSARRDRALERAPARQMLEQIVGLTVRTFPQAMLPNTLVQELHALSESAGLRLPLVEEVAADIFMGEFAAKFLRAAQQAAELLEGTLYARYYDIPTERIRRLNDVAPSRYGPQTSAAFAALCRERAGPAAVTGRPGSSVAHNGTILEQSQILTTHNLAVLFSGLGLDEALRPELASLARRCFVWICRRLRFRPPQETRHARLLAVKNSAYAWRQMVFYLSLMPADAQEAFLEWAEGELARQRPEFQWWFGPALAALRQAVRGETPKQEARPATGGAGGDDRRHDAGAGASQPFLGWTTGRHWLVAETS